MDHTGRDREEVVGFQRFKIPGRMPGQVGGEQLRRRPSHLPVRHDFRTVPAMRALWGSTIEQAAAFWQIEVHAAQEEQPGDVLVGERTALQPRFGVLDGL